MFFLFISTIQPINKYVEFYCMRKLCRDPVESVSSILQTGTDHRTTLARAMIISVSDTDYSLHLISFPFIQSHRETQNYNKTFLFATWMQQQSQNVGFVLASYCLSLHHLARLLLNSLGALLGKEYLGWMPSYVSFPHPCVQLKENCKPKQNLLQ